MVGDTQITDTRGNTSRVRGSTPILEGTLKVVALHPKLCIGWAGSLEIALPTIRALHVNPATEYSLDDVLPPLVKASIIGARTEFVIGALTAPPYLAAIRDGEIQQNTRCFAGERRAYSMFQHNLVDGGGPGDSAIGASSHLMTPLQKIVDQQLVEGVGHFCVEVRTTDEGFRYTGGGMASGLIRTGPGAPNAEHDEEWDSIEHGAYFENVLYPRQAGIGALGIYFKQIRLGALFYPAQAAHALVYLDVTHPEFVATVEREHRITMTGSRIDTDRGRNIVLR